MLYNNLKIIVQDINSTQDRNVDSKRI